MPTIDLTEDAYERLETLKREGESVSDVVLRLTDGQERLTGFGAWRDTGLGEAVEAAREEFEADFEERQDELFRR